MQASSSLLSRNAAAASAAAIAFAVTLFAPQVLNDGDTFLHIAAGARMLHDRAILFADPFSYTMAGAPWEAHEWLAEIVMAAAYRTGGWSGLLLLFALASGSAIYVLSLALGRRLAPAAQALVTLLAMACMTGSLLARPHLLALPLLAVWTAELAAARDGDRDPPLLLLPVMIVWANIHASFLLGLAVAGGLGVEAVVARRSSGRGWGLFLLGAFVAASINPHGIEGILFPLSLMATPSLAHVGEWQATPVSLFQPVVPITAAALYVLITRRVRLPLIRAAMLAVLAYLAFTHVRHQMVFAVTAPLLLAMPLAKAFGAPALDRDWRPAAALPVAVSVMLAVVRFVWPVERHDAPVAPIAALAHVPEPLRRAPVLNDYAFGGYLIFSGVRPFIDSRAELYGEEGLQRYAALLKPDRAVLDDVVRRYHVRWSILPPSSPLVGALDGAGWRRLYADRIAIVQFRDGGAR